MKIWPWMALSLLVVGCSKGSDLMPLKVGGKWDYESTNPIAKNVRTVVVDARVPVDKGNGYELRSESGVTNLIWNHDTLYSNKLSGTLYSPALAILRAGAEKADWTWDGDITGPLGITKAHATGSQQSADRDVGGHKVKSEQVTLTIISGKRSQEIMTWYAPGLGAIGQEERVNGVLVNKLDFVSGP